MVELSRSLAHYLLNRLPEDDVCHWDLALVGTDALRDSSSAAIAVCGLLELVKQLPVTHPDRESYEALGLKIIESMIDRYFNLTHQQGEGLLNHSVYHFKGNVGVNECCAWGDYFLMEAIARATSSWNSYW